MLSEGMVLNRALKSAGLKVVQSHPHFKKLGKADGIVVCLNRAGDVELLEPRTGKELVLYWQMQPDNQKRFPTLKLGCPVVEVAAGSAAESIRGKDGWTIWLRNAAAKAQAPVGKEMKKVGSRLRDYATDLLKDLQGGGPTPELEVFLELCRRAVGPAQEATEERGTRFVQSLLDALASSEASSVEVLELLLLGKWNSKKKEYEESEALLYLDIADYMTATAVGCRVYASIVGEAVNASLLRAEAVGTGAAEVGPCALSGAMMPIEKEKLPNPNLPQIGLSYLFSMNRDAPCHDRYGMIGPAIFSVGKETANDIKDALQHLTQPELWKQTWAGVPGIAVNSNDLLIAYLERMPRPTRPFPIVTLASSAPDLEGAVANQQYGKLAQEVMQTIKELKLSSNPSRELVRFFLLRKVDPGRCQMVMERAVTVERIEAGARGWEEACANVPNFWLFIPTEAKKPAIRRLPRALYPEQVQRAVAYQWLRSGERKERVGGAKEEKRQVAGCPLGDVFDMIFGEEERRRAIARSLLPLAVSRASPMLVQVGGALGKNEEREVSIPTRAAAIDVYTLLGALLHILKRTKESYMKGAAYQVGRMLSLLDVLHLQYSLIERSKDKVTNVPPQLLGNSLMGSALSNPTQALAIIAERGRLYTGWVDTLGYRAKGTEPKEVWRAKWAMRELSGCATALADLELPARMTDAEKAELLIGYLARPASSRGEENPKDKTEGEES